MFRIKMFAWGKTGGLNNPNNLFNNSFNKEAPKYIPIREHSELRGCGDKSNFNNSAYNEIKVNERAGSSSRSNWSKPFSSHLSNRENKLNYFFNNLNNGKEYNHSDTSTSPSKNNNGEFTKFKYNLSSKKNYDMERLNKLDNNTKLENSSNEQSYVKVKDSYNYNSINPSRSGFPSLSTQGIVQKMKYIKVKDTDQLFRELLKKREKRERERERNFLGSRSGIFNNKGFNKSLNRFPPPFRNRFFS